MRREAELHCLEMTTAIFPSRGTLDTTKKENKKSTGTRKKKKMGSRKKQKNYGERKEERRKEKREDRMDDECTGEP